MQVGFYHLTLSSLERALPRLLEKMVAAGHRVVVLTGSEERLKSLDHACWTYTPLSFLPHATPLDGLKPEDQPIWITTQPERPNGASVLVLTDGMEVQDLSPYNRCVVMQEGDAPETVASIKAFSNRLKAQQIPVIHWTQTQTGWVQGVVANPAIQEASLA